VRRARPGAEVAGPKARPTIAGVPAAGSAVAAQRRGTALRGTARYSMERLWRAVPDVQMQISGLSAQAAELRRALSSTDQ
jgi:hypothetical protein